MKRLPRNLGSVFLALFLTTSVISLNHVPVFAGASVGGTDVLVDAVAEPGASAATMDIASNGDIYAAAFRVNDAGTQHIITVYRSQDGGESWSVWGSFSNSVADGGTNPQIYIAEGVQDRVFVSYDKLGDVWVAYADLGAAIPIFTHQVALSAPVLALAGGRIESDAANYPDYFLYLAAHESQTGGDTYFARSIDQGATWETEYIIASAPGNGTYTHPTLAYGAGVVHCVMRFYDTDVSFLDNAIRYRRMLNFGSAGIADWDPIQEVTTLSDGLANNPPKIAASHISSNVVIASGSDSTAGTSSPYFTLIRSSTNGGVSWPGANSARLYDQSPRNMIALPGGGFALAVDHFQAPFIRFHKASDADPLSWTTYGLSDSENRISTTIRSADLDFDASRNDQIGMTFFHSSLMSDPDSIMFDAEWRAATGFPSVAAGFPVSVGSPIIVSPALAILDDDPHLEILFGTADGDLHAYNSDGSVVPGWPINMGSWPSSTPRNGTIAVGDINGDGKNEVVAGSGSGDAAAFGNDGTPLPGWPKSFGNDPVFVSIGQISGLSPRDVVVCTGKELYLYEADGTLVSGFPVTLSGTVPGAAAIGDLDDNGSNEMVATAGVAVDVISSAGAVLMTRVLGGGRTATASASLADMDLNGDLEIAVPATLGQVFLIDYPGGADLPGWPITTPLASTTTAIALVNNSGTSQPEVIFAEKDSTVHMYHYNGAANSNWPKNTGDGWFLNAGPTMDFIEDIISSDVLIGSRDSKAHAFRNTSGVVPGWPRLLGDQVEVSPASGDIDYDGKLEVVFGGLNQLWMLDVNQTVSRNQPNEIWPMMGYNAQRTSCLACEPDVVIAVDEPQRPQTLGFAPPVPNPSVGHQLFQFSLPQEGRVRITVYDTRGRLVREALDRTMQPGRHAFEWDGKDGAGRLLPSGIYFARLDLIGKGVEASRTQRLVLLR